MSAAVRDKIINFLSQGVSQAVAASAAGVSPSYVSQLLKEPEVLEEISKARAGQLQEDLETEKVLQAAERKALRAVVDKLPHVRHAVDAARVFQVLNGARRSREVSREEEVDRGNVVTLVLPKAANVMIQMNAANQIVAVDGESTAPLPSRVLPSLRKNLEQPEMVKQITSATDVECRTLAPLAPAPVKQREHVTRQLEKEAARDVKKAKEVFEGMKIHFGGKLLEI
jgi:hypothetical protein